MWACAGHPSSAPSHPLSALQPALALGDKCLDCVSLADLPSGFCWVQLCGSGILYNIYIYISSLSPVSGTELNFLSDRHVFCYS